MKYMRRHVLLVCGLPLALLAVLILCWGLGHEVSPSSPARLSPVAISRAVATKLDSQPCSWLDASVLAGAGGQKTLTISGVALMPEQIRPTVRHMTGNNLKVTAKVRPLYQNACSVIDVFRQFRTKPPLPQTLSMERRDYSLSLMGLNSGLCKSKYRGAKATFSIRAGSEDFVLIGVQATGEMQKLAITRNNLLNLAKSDPKNYPTAPDGSVSVTGCVQGEKLQAGEGLQAITIVLGQNLSSMPAISSTLPEFVTNQWLSDFSAKAKANGWHTEMAWFYIRP